MRSHHLSHGVLGALLSLVVATACGYDPNPASGKLHCGPDNSCPENYTCMSGRCWRNGSGGSTGTGGTTGGGGTGGSSGTAKFIGRWTFVVPSRRMIACSDGYTEDKEWDNLGELFDIVAGTAAPLATHYYCDWDLDIDATGNATVIRPGKTCTGTMAGTTYTWHGMVFTLTTSDGQTGTLIADIPYDWVTPSSGTCTMHFTGTMTKS
jgi:hypothetical protein